MATGNDERAKAIADLDREVLEVNLEMLRRTVTAAEKMSLACPTSAGHCMSYTAWTMLASIPGNSSDDQQFYNDEMYASLGKAAAVAATNEHIAAYSEFLGTIDSIRRTIHQKTQEMGKRWAELHRHPTRQPPESPRWVSDVLGQRRPGPVTVRLVNTTAARLIEALPDGCVDLVLSDPPWLYGKAGRPGHGKADDHFDGLEVSRILNELDALAPKCKRDAWLVLWLTFPLLDEFWVRGGARTFEYVTGGSWHKVSAKRGIGHHALGEAELWTLWRRGNPKTLQQFGNADATKRLGHSQKPPEVVSKHVRAWSPPGGLVLDCYAGEFATFAKVCVREGRRYIGAEADAARFDRAEKILKHYREIHST